MSRRSKGIGDWGEEKACEFLRRHGFAVKGRNYHTASGEIDIIAAKGGDYYFIEVKTRTQSELANDLSITHFKKMRMRKAAGSYCYKNNFCGSVVFAGLIICIDRPQKKANFRFCVFC